MGCDTHVGFKFSSSFVFIFGGLWLVRLKVFKIPDCLMWIFWIFHQTDLGGMTLMSRTIQYHLGEEFVWLARYVFIFHTKTTVTSCSLEMRSLAHKTNERTFPCWLEVLIHFAVGLHPYLPVVHEYQICEHGLHRCVETYCPSCRSDSRHTASVSSSDVSFRSGSLLT